MLRFMQISVALLLAGQAAPSAVAFDHVPGKGRLQSIEFMGGYLMLTDTGHLGLTKREPTTTEKPAGPPPPELHDVDYVWDGAHLRLGRDGQYLTADYSTDPPDVILTKQPTKDSQWGFVKAGTGRWQYYIKNENDRGKEAWLDMEDTGKRYSAREGRVGYRDIRIYKPVLSYRNKREFSVIDLLDDGGK